MPMKSAATRRDFLRIGLSASAALLTLELEGVESARADTKPKLLVFVPTDIQSLALQKMLAEALPGTDVVAFGRFRDFENGLAQKPDAALTLTPVLKAKGLASSVVGSNNGSNVEPYVLVSAGKSVEANKVTSVGAVDILGRQGMKDLVTELLGTTPNIERVTKVEDLLALLQFGSVDAVLLPERL